MTAGHDTAQAGRYIHANGVDIYYEEAGSGRPLFLIHGGLLTCASWEPYLSTFTPSYRVIMPDSRAHGRTNNPTGEMSFGLLADDAVALIRELGLEKPLIYGYSDGGQIALEIGMRYPDLPSALVIGGAYVETTDSSREWARSILGDESSPDVDIDRFEREFPHFAEGLTEDHGPDKWKVLLKQIKPMWNATLNYSPDDFAKVSAPVLVLIGDRDGFVPLEDGVRMYRLLPGAEMAVVPGADHGSFIFSPDRIKEIAPIIAAFLQRRAAASDQPPHES